MWRWEAAGNDVSSLTDKPGDVSDGQQEPKTRREASELPHC